MLYTIHDLMTHAGIVTVINDFTYEARATRVALGVGSIKNARSTIAEPIHDFVIDILRLYRKRIKTAIYDFGLYNSKELDVCMTTILTSIIDNMYESRANNGDYIDMPEYVWKTEVMKMLKEYVNTMQRFMVYEIRKDDEAFMRRILLHMHAANMPDVLDFRGEKIPEIYTAQAIVDHLPKSKTITDADIDKSIAAIIDEYKKAKPEYTLVERGNKPNESSRLYQKFARCYHRTGL